MDTVSDTLSLEKTDYCNQQLSIDPQLEVVRYDILPIQGFGVTILYERRQKKRRDFEASVFKFHHLSLKCL